MRMLTPVDDESLLSDGDAGSLEAQGRNCTWPRVAAPLSAVGLAMLLLVALRQARHGQAESRSMRTQVADEDPCSTGKSPCEPLTPAEMKDMGLHSFSGSGLCSGIGANCSQTKCCGGPGLQCFAKDAVWAECKATCIPGPDPRASDGGAWSCDELGERAGGEPPKCSKTSEDCNKSQCCRETGMQCYEKGTGWATCKAECQPGMDLTDSDSLPWTCRTLGRRTPDIAQWVSKVCAAPGTGCLDKRCCSSPGTQCYEKNAYWGECRHNCTKPWACKMHGHRTPFPAAPAASMWPPLADWVAEKCSESGEDCRSSKCCSARGNQCYQKNASHAVCKGSCTPGLDLYDPDPTAWWCHPLGPRTPGVAMSESWRRGDKVAKWVGTTCAASGFADCRKSKCCAEGGVQCWEKNDEWAACMMGCTPGPMPGDDGGGNWTCEPLGPRTHRAWGSPSLYCFSVVQPFNYEPGLVQAQQGTKAGIFACDEYSVFSTSHFPLGFGPNGPVETVTFVPAKVVRSKDYTAGNAELFMHVWESVRTLGLWQSTDWTVKVDPDAVLLPGRLRWHLEPHTGRSVYMVNCAKPYMPEGPMMFGALEAISHQALGTYYSQANACIGGLPWQKWGEDLFMGKCLEKLGVQRANDFTIYRDGACTGVDCTDPHAAAFHPKKDIASWMACLEQTKHPVTRPTTVAPQWFKDYMKSYAR